jgi:hypothetical protein
VRRSLPLIAAVALAVALPGCSDDDNDPIPVTEAEACKAVKEKLKLDALEDRFGAPDRSQDFFGDRVVTYDDDSVKWQFQVGAETGTFRAIRVEGQRERILDCPG